MSFHDDVATKARLDGNTAQQFRGAAQKHANAVWIWLIIGGVVWYFASWPWALIPLAVAIYTTIQSISATAVANRLAKRESPPT